MAIYDVPTDLSADGERLLQLSGRDSYDEELGGFQPPAGRREYEPWAWVHGTAGAGGRGRELRRVRDGAAVRPGRCRVPRAACRVPLTRLTGQRCATREPCPMGWPTHGLPEPVEQGRLHHEAGHELHSAQDALDAAKKMAADARQMREEAAREAKTKIDEASDAGIQNRAWWEEVGDWFSDNWDNIVAVCKIVVAVVGRRSVG